MQIYSDGTAVVLVGDFDVRSTSEVRAAIYAHLAIGDEVVVDLTGVSAVDHTALKVLAMATRNAAARGKRLTLRGCGRSVRRMIHLAHMAYMLEVERAA
jgi:anti-anti-sigma factor